MSAENPKPTDGPPAERNKGLVLSFYVHCPQCDRTFRVTRSAAAKRGTLFCSRNCFYKAWADFAATYRQRRAKQLQEAA